MKHLVIARYGSHTNNRINLDGHLQIEALSAAIKKTIGAGSAHIISSTAPRALDSSIILTVYLGLPLEFEHVPYLWSGDDAPNDSYYYKPSNDRIMQIIDERRGKADALIMVTHLEVGDSFPTFFARKELKQEGAHLYGLSNGQAVCFNLERPQGYSYLP